MNYLKVVGVGGLLAGMLMAPGASAIADSKGQKHAGTPKGLAGVHIPPGHLPPPGQCRIWYPGKPPGHQPPPGNCRTLSLQVPRGALLVSRDRRWTYEERPDRYYHRSNVNYGKPDWHYRRDDDRRSYWQKSEIREGVRDVREAQKDVRQAREELEKNRAELRNDRAELRKDIRQGASGKEIRQDRREVRESAQKVAESEKKLQQSQNQLETTRRELNQDLRRR